MTASMHMHGAESLRHSVQPPRGRAAAVTSCSPRRDPHCPAPATRDRSARPCAASHRSSATNKTLVRSKMADGSRADRAGPKQLNDLTFSAPAKRLGDSKKFSGETINGESVKLSFYRELDESESCEKSDDKDGVAATRAVFATDSQKSLDENATATDGDDRKKRCIDRYDSSESSDSGVAVLSPSESGGSCSDISEPRSPRSPESTCSATEEGAGAGTGLGARMPPWASDPAPPPAPRRIAVQPAPVRRHNPPLHRRITEYFNHKMKPQNGLKRDHNPIAQDDIKKKCQKNGVTHDLEKYISYLSQTLSPKVLMDVGRQNEAAALKPPNLTFNGASDTADQGKMPSSAVVNGTVDYGKSREGNERVHTTMNGFVDVRRGVDSFAKDKSVAGLRNGFVDNTKKGNERRTLDSSANGINKVSTSAPKGKVPIPALPIATVTRSPIKLAAKPDNRMNGVVSSTTKLDSRMNGVMCGSNNLSLNPHKMIPMKKDIPKKSNDAQSAKRTNRKSSACIANSKNLTWSKANNLKQLQHQKQKCINTNQHSSPKNIPGEANCSQKFISNGVRQVPMAVNGNLSNINLPINNLQNCHQINLPQSCNGTTTNMTSFVAVPQNVMLTTLRIPQTGIPAQTLSQQNNMTAFNRQNVNVSSPTKLNGQFVFPMMQNINGTVVQIPNLMAKMPNFVLPQNPQLTAQRQDHLQNQQTTQFLINGTLLKLSNTMPNPAYSNVNKAAPMNTQQGINKNVPGVPTVGMTVQQKPNYTVNFSHPVLVPQPGFIVTSVPNMSMKETWSYTGATATSIQSSCSNHMYTGSTVSSVQSNQMYTGSTATNLPSNQMYTGGSATSLPSACSNQSYTCNTPNSLPSSCSNQLLHHAPLVSYTNQTMHTSSIPIAPVKPPDNPIQGTEPPSSTVKEPDCELTSAKCDIPWLSKTVNNNIVPLEIRKKRPFAEVSSSYSDKFDELLSQKAIDEIEEDIKSEDMSDESRTDPIDEELRKVEEVARREDTIFTQITVLKDVSSNVHNSMIEANFCNATTDTESGIGTDKSIDSPISDSQTSKEGDEDSSLSLSISLCSSDVQSQKSPILKQPKTLRFPPRTLVKAESSKRTSSSDTSTTVSVCLWEHCKKEFDGDPDLLEHIQMTHVETQAGKENYVCLWERCKVFGKPSCSRLWLERHTLSHGGSKPFRCIVDGCERRFSTQTLLERHVNNHFNESSASAGGAKKTTDSATKLIRRNGKKLRYRRQPWSARMFDFFDAGMMEGLAWRLARCSRWRLGGGCLYAESASSRHTLTLHAALAATRYNAATSRREALLTYYPPHVVEDEWVPEKDVTRVKRVEIASLSVTAKVMLYEQFCDSYRKAASPTPVARAVPPPTPGPGPVRLLPARHCTSSRLLNNLIAKQKRSVDLKPECAAPTTPLLFTEDTADKVEVSGAKKRKLGRRYGGNAFWPCGR